MPYPRQNGLTPYQVIAADGSENGLFTGYFEPLLRGSATRSEKYAHAVYAPPSDLSVVPNYTNSGQPGQFAYGKINTLGNEQGEVTAHVSRADVMRGALENQNLELLYVDDAVDLFFAHVQGSAAIQMDDNSIKSGDHRSASLCERSRAASEHIIRIGFAAKSGHPYVAIGKTLYDMNVLQPPITMQSIKAWLRANPSQQEQILASNPSFIFFKMLEGTGPIGASGEVLMPEQSLAIDDTIWPYGLQVIVATHDPVDKQKPFIRLMRTQDTGSAIRGVIRGDIYFGSGDAAGAKAGAMNAAGKLWILLPD